MQRILFIVTVLFILWRLLSAFGKRVGRDASGAEDFSRFSARRRDHRRRMKEAADRAGEDLVACSRCATWVPAARLVRDTEGRLFCSETCRSSASPPPE